MKFMAILMAFFLVIAFALAVYSYIELEPGMLTAAGIFGGLAVAPLVFGYGYKLSILAIRHLATQSNPDGNHLPQRISGAASGESHSLSFQNTPAHKPKRNEYLPEEAHQLSPSSVNAVDISNQTKPQVDPTEIHTRVVMPSTTAEMQATRDSDETTSCPFCGETILKKAKKCKHCSEFLDPILRHQNQSTIPQHGTIVNINQPAPRTSSNGMAALLSLFLPGLGQMVSGRVGTGICWLIFVAVAYGLFFFPGLILHIMCIVDAGRET